MSAPPQVASVRASVISCPPEVSEAGDISGLSGGQIGGQDEAGRYSSLVGDRFGKSTAVSESTRDNPTGTKFDASCSKEDNNSGESSIAYPLKRLDDRATESAIGGERRVMNESMSSDSPSSGTSGHWEGGEAKFRVGDATGDGWHIEGDDDRPVYEELSEEECPVDGGKATRGDGVNCVGAGGRGKVQSVSDENKASSPQCLVVSSHLQGNATDTLTSTGGSVSYLTSPPGSCDEVTSSRRQNETSGCCGGVSIGGVSTTQGGAFDAVADSKENLTQGKDKSYFRTATSSSTGSSYEPVMTTPQLAQTSSTPPCPSSETLGTDFVERTRPETVKRTPSPKGGRPSTPKSPMYQFSATVDALLANHSSEGLLRTAPASPIDTESQQKPPAMNATPGIHKTAPLPSATTTTTTATNFSSLPSRCREIPFRVPTDLKVLCRLIASHQKSPKVGDVVSFYADSRTHSYTVLLNVDIGHNVCCLAYEKKLPAKVGSAATSLPISEVVFAFNWFSPKSVWDYVSLGTRVLSQTSGIDDSYRMCSQFYLNQALEFILSPAVSDLLQELALGFVKDDRHNLAAKSASGVRSAVVAGTATRKLAQGPAIPSVHKRALHVDKITVCGFSMGGSIAHAFSLLLKRHKELPQIVRCVGFGSGRPGNSRFSEWCKNNLSSDSMNIVLASEEPVENPEGQLDELEVEIRHREEYDTRDINAAAYLPLTQPTQVSHPAGNSFSTTNRSLESSAVTKSSHGASNSLCGGSAVLSTARTTVDCCVRPEASKPPSSITIQPGHHISLSQTVEGGKHRPAVRSGAPLTQMGKQILPPSPQGTYPINRKLFSQVTPLNPTVLLYDPVCLTPNTCKGFDIQPNLHVLLQNKSGWLYKMGDHERERLRYNDTQAASYMVNTIVNLATRGSPFAADFSRGWDKLHSVLKYYEAMYDNSCE